MPRSSCIGKNSCSRHPFFPWQEHPENPRTNSTGSVVCEEDWTTRCTGTKTPHRNTEGRFMETRMPGQHASCKKSSLLSSRWRWSRSFNLVDWVPGDKLGSSRGTHEDLVCNQPSPPFSNSSSVDQSWFNYMCTVSSLHTKQYIFCTWTCERNFLIKGAIASHGPAQKPFKYISHIWQLIKKTRKW